MQSPSLLTCPLTRESGRDAVDFCMVALPGSGRFACMHLANARCQFAFLFEAGATSDVLKIVGGGFHFGFLAD